MELGKALTMMLISSISDVDWCCCKWGGWARGVPLADASETGDLRGVGCKSHALNSGRGSMPKVYCPDASRSCYMSSMLLLRMRSMDGPIG